MYYQKGTQRIEVIVKKQTSGGGLVGAKERSAENIADGQTSAYSKIFGTSSEARKKRIIKTNATHILSVGKHLIDTGVNYWVQGLSMEYGDEALQQQVERKIEMFNDPIDFASSVGMGALYGAWGGPIGAVIGASLGAVTSGASLAIKYKGRERNFNYKVFKENNAIEYKKARARINLTTGRLR